MQNTEIRPITYTKSKAPKCKLQCRANSVNYIKLKCFCAGNGEKISKMKRQPTEQEKKKKLHNSIGKKKNTDQKMGRGTEQTFFPKRAYIRPAGTWKDAQKLTNHQEMQNRSYKEISPHTPDMTLRTAVIEKNNKIRNSKCW